MMRPPIAIAAVVVFITRIMTRPQSFWQGEEIRFARALLTFDPIQQQPEPPGYPLYVAIGRVINFFVHQPFFTLLILSAVSVLIGAYLVGLLVAEVFGDDWTGVAAILILYFSPAMLAFDALPNPEAITVALLATAFLALIRGHTIWFGVAAAAAVAVRPEIAIAMFIVVLLRPRALPAFLAVLIVAFIPLLEAIGSNLVPYVKTNYLALRTSSDAAGLHGRELFLRFVAHPWGSKWISFPVLVFAVVGFFVIARRARALAATLGLFFVAHVAFVVAMGDRADGVQPVLPALIVVAIFAASAFAEWPRVAAIAALLYACGGVAYAWPLLHERTTSAAPPARAMRFARRLVPQEAILLYEPSMEAWAGLGRFTTIAPARDFDRYADRVDTPLFLLADGGSRTPHAARFEWPDSDPYGKITTERYRVASIIPYPPPNRYRSLGGLYAFERTADGREWRWLTDDAVLQLPRLVKRVVQVTLALPDDAPIPANTIAVNGTAFVVNRGQQVSISFPTSTILHIRAAHTFTSPRDQRTLAVQLVALEQR